MQVPLQVVFRNMRRSKAIEQLIEQRVQKLESFYKHLISCRVVVEMPHRHHHQGNQFQVTIHLTVPNDEIVVSAEPSTHSEAEDFQSAIRDAFDSAKRRLEQYVERRRGLVKAHTKERKGRVIDLMSETGEGLLESDRGDTVQFTIESVKISERSLLVIGALVTYTEMDNDERWAADVTVQSVELELQV